MWFRNDLRLTDHEALSKAIDLAKQRKSSVVPFYCFEKHLFTQQARISKVPRMGALRARFLLESVQDLNTNLQTLGSGLFVRVDNVAQHVLQLAQQLNVHTVFAHKEVCSEETSTEKHVEEALKKANIAVTWFWTHTMVHKDDLPYKNMQEVSNIFTPFRKRCEKDGELYKRVRAPLPKITDGTHLIKSNKDLQGEMPTLDTLFGKATPVQDDARGVLKFVGGETEALKRLDEYFWKKDCLKKYVDTRNELLGANYSSKLSAWLSLGCISPRTMYEHVRKYEKQNGASESTQHFISEMIWRDFYRFLAYKHGDNIFYKRGMWPNRQPMYSWPVEQTKFQAWVNGTTGYPFVDANMRELKQTGWMSNRGRQVVASFLAKDLNVDWRMGAEYFEMALLDFDVTSNWCNWNWAAGVGCDPRNRYFNSLKQGTDYDEQGKFIKTWIPELNKVPVPVCHVPFVLTAAEQKKYACIVKDNYAMPICAVSPPSTWKKDMRDRTIAGLKHLGSLPKHKGFAPKRASDTTTTTSNGDEEEDDNAEEEADAKPAKKQKLK